MEAPGLEALRERLISYLRDAREERRSYYLEGGRPSSRSYGTVKTKRFALALGAWVEVSLARYHGGKYRIFVTRECPYGGPRLVLRLAWGDDEPLAATCFTSGDWLEDLPMPARATGEPEKLTPHHSHDGKTRRVRPWTAS
jgi:hypothetical protein